ncbi:MAG TPA: hypothetical protein VED17_07975, partial [Nitrososphaerales archaeon]|nr:hypothetical protein [Nitrososphaerales archaeon]
MTTNLAVPERLKPRSILDWLLDRGDYVFALCVYVLLTILFTWPLATNFSTFVNGNSFDVFHELWYLHLGSTSPTGPFFVFSSMMSYYPTGTPLYFQVLSPFNTLNFAWLAPLFGEVVAYNVLYMFTFFFAGFTTYIFVKYLTKNNYAAFLAGLAFAFAPIHTGQGFDHLNIMSAEFIPLFAYFMVKLARERNMWNSVYTGAAMVLNAMCDLHMFLLCAAMFVVYHIYTILTQRKLMVNRAYIQRLIVMSVFTALVGFVVYFQTVYGLFFVPKTIGAASSATRYFSARSADLVSFFVPSSANPFLSRYVSSINVAIGKTSVLPNEGGTAYIGYTVLTLSILGLIFFWQKRDVYFWGLLALVGAILAVGPYIRILGVASPIPGVWGYLYYVVPLLNSFRAPYRFDYLVALGLAILAGYGTTGLMNRVNGIKLPVTSKALMKVFVLIILCTLITVEFIPIPYAEYYGPIPQFYQVLAHDHSNYTVLEVPIVNPDQSLYLYYQSAYNKPMIDGSIARNPAFPGILYESTPFIDQLGPFSPTASPTDIINQTFPMITLAPYILAQYNVKYIIVHKDLFSNSTDYLPYVQLLTQILGQPIYQDSSLVAFRFTPPDPGMGVVQFLQTYENISVISFLNGNWLRKGLFGANARALSGFAGLSIFS